METICLQRGGENNASNTEANAYTRRELEAEANQGRGASTHEKSRTHKNYGNGNPRMRQVEMARASRGVGRSEWANGCPVE